MEQKLVRILIVDDSIVAQKLLNHIYSRDNDIQVVGIASNGVEALELTLANKPDVISMDIHMPNKDGIMATKDIREMSNPAKNSVPIIALTANTQIGVNNRYLEMGMDGYLSKPFKEDELYNLISSVLEKRKH